MNLCGYRLGVKMSCMVKIKTPQDAAHHMQKFIVGWAIALVLGVLFLIGLGIYLHAENILPIESVHLTVGVGAFAVAAVGLLISIAISFYQLKFIGWSGVVHDAHKPLK